MNYRTTSLSLLPIQFFLNLFTPFHFPGGSDGKQSACKEGDMGLIPEVGGSPGGGNDNSLQDTFLENIMDGGAWRLQSMGS